jgi:hypothetical protein
MVVFGTYNIALFCSGWRLVFASSTELAGKLILGIRIMRE